MISIRLFKPVPLTSVDYAPQWKPLRLTKAQSGYAGHQLRRLFWRGVEKLLLRWGRLDWSKTAEHTTYEFDPARVEGLASVRFQIRELERNGKTPQTLYIGPGALAQLDYDVSKEFPFYAHYQPLPSTSENILGLKVVFLPYIDGAVVTPA